MKDELAPKHHALFCWCGLQPQYFIDLFEIFFSIGVLKIFSNSTMWNIKVLFLNLKLQNENLILGTYLHIYNN